MYGALAGYTASMLPGGWLYAGLATGGFLIVLAFYTFYRMMLLRLGGVTTLIVMLLVYTLGFTAGLGYSLEAVAASAVVTLLLAVKTPIARLVERISYEELLALFELALFYLALAPLVYTSNVSIMGVRLSTIYTFFLLVITVSFAGYIAWRLGAKPTIYALLGGFVNSEAAIALVARGAEPVEPLAAYVNLGMQYKAVILALAAAYLSKGPLLAVRTAPPLLAALAASTLLALRWRVSEAPRLQFRSPLELGVAVKTVVVYAALFLAAAALSPYLEKPGLAAAYAALGGLVSATATIFALAAYLPPDTLLHAAVYSLAIAAATLNKPLYARAGGGRRMYEVAKVSVIQAAPFIAVAAAAWLAALRA